jgi:hypothetical protein
MFRGNKTWLQLLCEPINDNCNERMRLVKFKNRVEMGANGLSEDGLKNVLQVPKESSFAQIVEKLNNEVFTDETAEAVWWHGNPRRSNEKNASIRLLPWMDEREQSELRRASELWSQQTGLSAPEYFFSSSQAQNMSVFAIDMIATPNTITQVESLIYHLIPYINPLNYEFRSGFDDASQRERFESIICQHSTGVPIFCSSTWANQHSPFGKLHEIIHSLNKYFTIIDEHGNIV